MATADPFFYHQIPRSIIAALQFFVNLTTGNPSSNSSGRAFTEHLIESETWIRGWMNGRREFRAPRLLNSAICSLIANGIRSIKNGGSCESEIPLYRGRRGRNGYDSTFVDGKRGEIESITIVPSYQLHLPRPFHLNGNSQSRTNPLNNSHSVGDRTEGFPTRSVVEGNSSSNKSSELRRLLTADTDFRLFVFIGELVTVGNVPSLFSPATRIDVDVIGILLRSAIWSCDVVLMQKERWGTAVSFFFFAFVIFWEGRISAVHLHAITIPLSIFRSAVELASTDPMLTTKKPPLNGLWRVRWWFLRMAIKPLWRMG